MTWKKEKKWWIPVKLPEAGGSLECSSTLVNLWHKICRSTCKVHLLANSQFLLYWALENSIQLILVMQIVP